MTNDPYYIIGLILALSLVPFVAIMLTSFTKLVVVFLLIRNALGIQQIPPNLVLNGLAIIISIYIMAPVGHQMADLVKDEDFTHPDTKSILKIVEKAKEPLRVFLLKHCSNRERTFFLRSAEKIWPEEKRQTLKENDFIIVIPAFTVSELTEAFEIGFLIYLPFVAIDIIISNILLAMGMMMVSPMTISVPFKLLLFVLVEGWAKIIHGLILNY